jgi:lipoyl(octanoyl) transferase
MSDLRITEIRDLGLMDYKTCWDYQTRLFQENVDIKIANRKAERTNAPQSRTNNYLLLVEHPHVYTLGKSGASSNLLIDEKHLERIGASYYHINRGGDITYHGPGQLVVYPIFDLDYFFTDIHKYMRFLEEVIIKVCEDYGLKAGREEGQTGVWIPQQIGPKAKICAMGVKSSRWVTMHGLAFNIQPDLSYFGNIVPCGISDKPVTSLTKETGKEIEMNAIKEKVIAYFQEIFGILPKS